MKWEEIYNDAQAFREDAIRNNREMSKHEVSQFMNELMKAIKEDKLLDKE